MCIVGLSFAELKMDKTVHFYQLLPEFAFCTVKYKDQSLVVQKELA